MNKERLRYERAYNWLLAHSHYGMEMTEENLTIIEDAYKRYIEIDKLLKEEERNEKK